MQEFIEIYKIISDLIKSMKLISLNKENEPTDGFLEHFPKVNNEVKRFFGSIKKADITKFIDEIKSSFINEDVVGLVDESKEIIGSIKPNLQEFIKKSSFDPKKTEEFKFVENQNRIEDDFFDYDFFDSSYKKEDKILNSFSYKKPLGDFVSANESKIKTKNAYEINTNKKDSFDIETIGRKLADALEEASLNMAVSDYY